MIFEEFLESLDIAYENHHLEQFHLYYETLLEWNSFMNLTAITNEEEVFNKHFADSLSILNICPELREKKPITVIDVGTGAGFPGIPIKILFDPVEMVLLDSLQKRIHFLDHLIAKLGLKGIRTLHARAEEAARLPMYREQFDLSVSRAVAKLTTLTEYCLPFVKKGGCFAAYKTEDIQEEIDCAEKAIKVLGGTIECSEKYAIAGTERKRMLVKIKKIKNTPKNYPRAGGKPIKDPL